MPTDDLADPNMTRDDAALYEVLVSIELVEWLLKDVHYRAQDEWFYALHELAERIDFGDVEDDLKECYWMGERTELPPDEATIHASTVDAALKYRGALSNHDLLQAVMDAASFGKDNVETAKKTPDLSGGVQALLDDASKCFLRTRALCWRSLNANGAVLGVTHDEPEEALGKFLAVTAVE